MEHEHIQRARSELRQQLKARRQQLSATEQQQAAQQLVEQVLQQPMLQTARRIALYHSFAAELDTGPLLDALLNAGKQLCLPVLHPFAKGHLLLLDYHADTSMRLNQYGIPEPMLECQHIVPLSDVDCMFTPLVGFDRMGNRLGMGGGFYDRTLASWARGNYPRLQVCGLAHDCQHVEQIPIQPWDIPIPMVITPSQCWRFASQNV